MCFVLVWFSPSLNEFLWECCSVFPIKTARWPTFPLHLQRHITGPLSSVPDTTKTALATSIETLLACSSPGPYVKTSLFRILMCSWDIKDTLFSYTMVGGLKLYSQETQRWLWSRRLKRRTWGYAQCRAEDSGASWDTETSWAVAPLNSVSDNPKNSGARIGLRNCTGQWEQVRASTISQSLIWDVLRKGVTWGKRLSPIKGNFKRGWF